MKNLIGLSVLAVLLITGCGMSKENTEVFKSSSGLQVEVATPVSVEEVKGGFIFYLSEKGGRQSNTVKVLIGSYPDAQKVQKKMIDGVEYMFRSDSFEGGSGGTEYTVEIWKPCSSGEHIYIEHYYQSDYDDKGAVAWDIAKSAKCES